MSTDSRWEELARDDAPALGDTRVYETDVAVATGSVLLGRDAEGFRHLLVPVAEEAEVREDRRSRGVQVLRRELIDRGRSRIFCDVACLSQHLQELFSVLADEMLSGLDGATETPDEICIAVLDRWRELLERESGRLLGTNQLAGLFAELWYLERVVELSEAGAVRCWAGPEGGVHDLRSGSVALEVKAITARYGRVVEIHGQEQLRPPDGTPLHLGVLRLQSGAPDGVSVPERVESLLGLGVDREELLRRLGRIGYRIDDQEAYAAVRFEVGENLMYLVDASFPRIVPKSFIGGKVPAGVLRLVYQIDLTGEPPDPLDQARTEVVLQGLGSG